MHELENFLLSYWNDFVECCLKGKQSGEATSTSSAGAKNRFYIDRLESSTGSFCYCSRRANRIERILSILQKLKMKTHLFFLLVNFLILINLASAKKATGDNKPAWAKKDIRDYNDADLERLLDQWEVR